MFAFVRLPWEVESRGACGTRFSSNDIWTQFKGAISKIIDSKMLSLILVQDMLMSKIFWPADQIRKRLQTNTESCDNILAAHQLKAGLWGNTEEKKC